MNRLNSSSNCFYHMLYYYYSQRLPQSLFFVLCDPHIKEKLFHQTAFL
jgi:hypothetical protein